MWHHLSANAKSFFKFWWGIAAVPFNSHGNPTCSIILSILLRKEDDCHGVMVIRFVVCLKFKLIVVLCQVWLEDASMFFVICLVPILFWFCGVLNCQVFAGRWLRLTRGFFYLFFLFFLLFLFYSFYLPRDTNVTILLLSSSPYPIGRWAFNNKRDAYEIKNNLVLVECWVALSKHQHWG